MVAAFLLAVVGVWNGEVTPCFDLIEVNHKLDEEGNEQFVQLIAWSWSPDYPRFHCEGWRLLESWRRTPRGVRYLRQGQMQWEEINGEFRVTWAYNDPERDDQQYYPQTCRQWK